MKDIACLVTRKEWVKIDLLCKGWSKDIKYIVEDKLQNKFLLRVSDSASYDRKYNQFNFLKEIEKLGVNTPRPYEIDRFEDGSVYMVLSWVEGKDAQGIMPTLDENNQYLLGKEAGRILKKIHSIPVVSDKPWNDVYQNKIPRKIKLAKGASIKHPHLDVFVNYVLTNMYLIEDSNTKWQHGDYHLGNMVITNDLKLGIVDFDKADKADPIDDFKPFFWNVINTPAFEIGLIDGYFDDKPTETFFKKLALYAAESCIGHVFWAIQFGEEEVKTALEICDKVYEWYKGFTTFIPTWYDNKLKEKK